MKWAVKTRGSGKAADFGEVREDTQSEVLRQSMKERFPERVQRVIMALRKEEFADWEIIPDEVGYEAQRTVSRI